MEMTFRNILLYYILDSTVSHPVLYLYPAMPLFMTVPAFSVAVMMGEIVLAAGIFMLCYRRSGYETD